MACETGILRKVLDTTNGELGHPKAQKAFSVPEIRAEIWKNLAHTLAHEGNDETRYFDLDPITRSWTNPNTVIPLKIDVDDDGSCDIFKEAILQIPGVMHEFLDVTRDTIIFKIKGPAGLLTFCNTITSALADGGFLVPRFRIEIRFLPERVLRFDIPAIRGITYDMMPHNLPDPYSHPLTRSHYDHHYQDHVKPWMNLVSVLSTNIAIDVVMLAPWRNYELLHTATTPLRAKGRELRLRLRMPDARPFSPQRDLRINLCIASFKGLKCCGLSQRNDGTTLSELDVQTLIRLGCRGFRRWIALD